VLGRDVKCMDRQNCSHKSGKEVIGLDESVMCVTMPFQLIPFAHNSISGGCYK
jgi:hypothetical protein